MTQFDVEKPDLPLTAFVLAGGKSTRMGRDKAMLEVGGKRLLDRVLETVRQVAPRVRIVGDPLKLSSFAPVVPDRYAERGPLGGIHAALMSSRTELNLMMAVDLPFVPAGFLEYLVTRAGGGASVTLARTALGFQPLCAVYRRDFAEKATAALDEGRNRIDLLFSQVTTSIIEPEELQREGFPEQIFMNVNTPAEYEEARARMMED